MTEKPEFLTDFEHREMLRDALKEVYEATRTRTKDSAELAFIVDHIYEKSKSTLFYSMWMTGDRGHWE